MVKMGSILWTALFLMLAGASANHESMPSTNLAVQEPQHVLHPDVGFAKDVEVYKTATQSHQTHQTLVSEDGTLLNVSTELGVRADWFFEMSLGKALELAKIKAVELDLKQVASDIETWVEHHPWKAAFYTASAIGLFAPEILSLPALEALGFGFAGVRAGSIASKIQSVIGDVAARSVFAIWQSARIGGYGVEYVNGGVRALVVLTDAAVAACNPLKDCKGLINDGGPRLLGDSMATVALAVTCGCLVGLNILLE